MAVRGGYLLQLGQVPYREAWDLQRSLAGAVSQGAVPDHGDPARAPAGGHARARRDRTRAPRGATPSTSQRRARIDDRNTLRSGKSTFQGPSTSSCCSRHRATRRTGTCLGSASSRGERDHRRCSSRITVSGHGALRDSLRRASAEDPRLRDTGPARAAAGTRPTAIALPGFEPLAQLLQEPAGVRAVDEPVS